MCVGGGRAGGGCGGGRGGGGGGGGEGAVEAKSKLGERSLSMTLAKRYFQGHGYFSLLTQNSANSLLIVPADTEAIAHSSGAV